uniref:WD_REPEATS_REGION domain-containing protein n=1 Tax=Parastrongyloides trichosuri TaxID=131310 RepID=A0A0N4Z9D3_PARTI
MNSDSSIVYLQDDESELRDEYNVEEEISIDKQSKIERNSSEHPDIPLLLSTDIHHGTSAITTIALDNQGLKFYSGDLNYTVKMFDFQKMDSHLLAERTINPCERHIINCISISNNGEYTLIANTSPIIYILDRNGSVFGETARGDQYLFDIKQTKGHTTSVNYCTWNPIKKDEFLSCSSDGSLRIWSIDDYKEISKCINKQRHVIKMKSLSGSKVIPNVCAYSLNGKFIVAGCEDGSIFIWKNGKVFVTPNYSNKNAHSDCVTSVVFSPDSTKLLSRSKDGTLKLWNATKLTTPEIVVSDLPCDQSLMDCGFSPHGNYIYTICSESNKNEGGFIKIFDKSLKLICTKKLNKNPTRIDWHPKINQIIVGFTDGSLTVFYDLDNSIKGILDCVSRKGKKINKNAVVQSEIILAPLTLDYFQPRGEDDEEKDLTEWRIKKALKMGSNIKKPTFITAEYDPQSISNKTGGTLHSYLARNMGMDRNKMLRENDDIRGSILKHAEAAEKNPVFTGIAYGKTQPKTILARSHEDDDDDVIPTKVKKFGE